MSRVVVIIPARFGSTRFPGKALADDTGQPLIQHVFEKASRSKCADRVVVATDDGRIADAVRGFGGEALMTSSSHANGTSRIAEAADALGLADADIIVNVQGDEPELAPELIDAVVASLRQSDAPMATAASPFADDEDPADPNIVKVTRSESGDALTFSRKVETPDAGAGAKAPLKHVGLYAYRRSFLSEYVSLSPTPLEKKERLEQLRAIEHGHRIAVCVCDAALHGVDTPEQYAQFVQRWRAAH